MQERKIAFVNVGANSIHGNLRSPIFKDSTFEFVPIPDPILEMASRDIGIRYENLKAFNGTAFDEFIPSKHLTEFAHADPDFLHFTYGDYPDQSPRASNLKKLVRGDYLIFLSRLVPWIDEHFSGRGGFYLIGLFEIGKIFKNIINQPEEEILEQIETNAHIIRGKCDPLLYDGFWIFKGTMKSRRFKKAIPLDKTKVKMFGFLDRYGRNWNWRKFSSDVAAIGSYLRSVKIIANPAQVNKILRICNQK